MYLVLVITFVCNNIFRISPIVNNICLYNLLGGSTLEWKHVFRKMDVSNDGNISINEFVKGIRKAGRISRELVTDQELMTLFREFDEDDSLQIELAEFITFITKTPVQHKIHR